MSSIVGQLGGWPGWAPFFTLRLNSLPCCSDVQLPNRLIVCLSCSGAYLATIQRFRDSCLTQAGYISEPGSAIGP